MATEDNATQIYQAAVTVARRLQDAFTLAERLYAYLAGLSADDLQNSAGGGMSQAQAILVKSFAAEAHDLACKWEGQAGMTDAAQQPITLPHDYTTFAERVIGPRITI